MKLMSKGLPTCIRSSPEIRGTYKALGHPVMVAYFKQLGITALELLPVAQFASEPRLQRMGLTNYWGYNPMAMFALHPAGQFARDGAGRVSRCGESAASRGD